VKVPAIIFVGALVVRLMTMAYFLPKFKSDVDLDFYHSIARNLAAGNGYVATGPTGRELPDVGRVPVYPLFLAGLIRLGGDRLGWLLAVQCVLGAATCGLTVRLAQRWLPAAGATFAGALMALDPNAVVRCSDLRADTLFAFLLVLVVLLATRLEAWSWLLAGLTCAVAVLCRPIASWAWLVVFGAGWKQRVPWRSLALFVAAFLPLLALWAGRNAAVTGRWFVSTSANTSLEYNWIVAADERSLGLDAAVRKVARELGDLEFFQDRESFEKSLQAVRHRARELVRTEPGFVAKQAMLGWGGVLTGPGARGLQNSFQAPTPTARWWPPVYWAVLAVMTVLAVVGAVRLGWSAALVWGLGLYFVVLVGGPSGSSRFRLPIAPFLAVLTVASVRKR